MRIEKERDNGEEKKGRRERREIKRVGWREGGKQREWGGGRRKSDT